MHIADAAPAPANIYVPASVSGAGVPSPSTPLNAGDCALLIQMTGTVGGGIGTYEILDPATATPTRAYNPFEQVQYVVLPGGCSQAIDVNSTYSPMPWNGATGLGGVVFLGGTVLTLNADINADGAGFETSDSTGGACDGGDGDPVVQDIMWEAGGGGGGLIGGGGGASGHIGDTDFSTADTFDGSGGGGGTDSAAGLGGLNGDSYGFSPSGGAAGCIGNGGDLANNQVWPGFWTTGAGGGGGGSYGGGGGGCSSRNSGAYAGGGGAGGSYTGGGIGGAGGTNVGAQFVTPEPNGVSGNAPVPAPIPNSAHYFNDTDPRLMMGGAGGRRWSVLDPNGFNPNNGPFAGGAGGGIVVLAFDSVVGNGFEVSSDGADGATPTNLNPGGSPMHGSSGSGGGGGGQILVSAPTVSSIDVSAAGGLGGQALTDTGGEFPHTGSTGASGGGGGIWFPDAGATGSNSGADQGATSATSTLAAPGLTGVDWYVDGGNPALANHPGPVTIGGVTYTGAAWAAIVDAAEQMSYATGDWLGPSLVAAAGGAFTLEDLGLFFARLQQPDNPKNDGFGCTPGLGGTGLVVLSQLEVVEPTPTPTPTPTATPIPPTAVPPTATAVPPTATAVPPTATAVPPTAVPPTSVPPTSVPSVVPTATAVVPTPVPPTPVLPTPEPTAGAQTFASPARGEFVPPPSTSDADAGAETALDAAADAGEDSDDPPATLALTGVESKHLALSGLALLTVGACFVCESRRRQKLY